jgi:hypothetical protein
MHRDIDEHHGKSLPDVPNFGDVDVSKDDFKYPEHGHVLYCGVEGEIGRGAKDGQEINYSSSLRSPRILHSTISNILLLVASLLAITHPNPFHDSLRSSQDRTN